MAKKETVKKYTKEEATKKIRELHSQVKCEVCGTPIGHKYHDNNLRGIIRYCSKECRAKRHNKKVVA